MEDIERSIPLLSHTVGGQTGMNISTLKCKFHVVELNLQEIKQF